MNLFDKDLISLNERIEEKKNGIKVLEENRTNMDISKWNLQYLIMDIENEISKLKSQEIKYNKFSKKGKELKFRKKLILKISFLVWLIGLLLSLFNVFGIGVFSVFTSSILLFDAFYNISNKKKYKKFKKECKEISLSNINFSIDKLETDKYQKEIMVSNYDKQIEELNNKIKLLQSDLDKLQGEYNIIFDYYENAKNNVGIDESDILYDSAIDKEHANVIGEMVAKNYCKKRDNDV